jgi:hypothetical protein
MHVALAACLVGAAARVGVCDHVLNFALILLMTTGVEHVWQEYEDSGGLSTGLAI